MISKPGKDCRDKLQQWKNKLQLCIDEEKPLQENPEAASKSIAHEISESKRLSTVINGMMAQMGKVLTDTEASHQKTFPEWYDENFPPPHLSCF